MKSSLKTIILLFSLLSLSIYLAGCKKTAAANNSIVGTWAFKTERNHFITNKVTQSDSTSPVPSGMTVTFTANGQIIAPVGINILPVNGSYSVIGNTLIFFDSLAYTNGSMTIASLSAHSRALTYNDTSTITPHVSYDQVTDSYTR